MPSTKICCFTCFHACSLQPWHLELNPKLLSFSSSYRNLSFSTRHHSQAGQCFVNTSCSPPHLHRTGFAFLTHTRYRTSLWRQQQQGLFGFFWVTDYYGKVAGKKKKKSPCMNLLSCVYNKNSRLHNCFRSNKATPKAVPTQKTQI